MAGSPGHDEPAAGARWPRAPAPPFSSVPLWPARLARARCRLRARSRSWSWLSLLPDGNVRLDGAVPGHDNQGDRTDDDAARDQQARTHGFADEEGAQNDGNHRV